MRPKTKISYFYQAK